MLPKPTERGRGKAVDEAEGCDAAGQVAQAVGRGKPLLSGRGRDDFQEVVGRDRGVNIGITMSNTVTDDSSGDMYVACSDDDLYMPGEEDRGKLDWMPNPTEILKLYELLEKQGYLDLEWRCPGRRPPAQPESLSSQEEDEGEDTNAGVDFDFEDESPSAPSVINTPQHRRPPGMEGLRGSARKKTTSLDSVLANMKKHRQIDEMDTGANPNNKQN